MSDPNQVCYLCKYTPIELFAGFGRECRLLDERADGFELSDQMAHPNLCGFSRAVLERVLSGDVSELVVVNCCDAMRRVFDVASRNGHLDFIHLLDLPHSHDCCARDLLARNLVKLKDAYSAYCGIAFDKDAFCRALASADEDGDKVVGPYIGVLGTHAGSELTRAIAEVSPLPVRDLTCMGNRRIAVDGAGPEAAGDAGSAVAPGNAEKPADSETDGGTLTLGSLSEEELFRRYAAALLAQLPCRRMDDHLSRRKLVEDPNLKGIVFHTMRFCDFYGSEYDDLHSRVDIPMLKIETDYLHGVDGQLRTRLEAFSETLAPRKTARSSATPAARSTHRYFVGIDSGSSSTDVVVLDEEGRIVAKKIVSTGGAARASAEKCLAAALDEAGIARGDVERIVTTGYGRSNLDKGDSSITEITCHARGAHYLDPRVRTVIDIGGQDSKVIGLDENGAVLDFAMNDKCAAGTGRFLEMTAHALELSLEEMGELGLNWKNDIAITSTCTVFAESEVVSLVAENVPLTDIVHGLDKSIASRTASLVSRVRHEGPFMMTGGLAHNAGLVKALEEKLGEHLLVSDMAQLAGALGAALIARES